MTNHITYWFKFLKYLFFPALFFVLYKLQHQRVAAFGCFDDCFNYGAAYFMLKGKILYSEIFFNHQVLMPYISYLVQLLLHPHTIYQLLVYHHALVFLFAILMDSFIIYKFRFSGIGFVLCYEFTKFYLFGDRFLAEAFIVYPIVYMFGILWNTLQKKRIFSYDVFLSGVFTWFIIFMREPYIPLALFLYLGILRNKSIKKKIKFISLSIFIVLSSIILFSIPIKDYFFNLVTINASTGVKDEIQHNTLFSSGLLHILGYPLFIFFTGEKNLFHMFLISLSSIFIVLGGVLLIKLRRYLEILTILFFLGIANIRYIPPGTIYYEAFHMLEWYGIFIFAIFLMLSAISPYFKSLRYISVFILLTSLSFITLSPKSIFREKVNRQEEFVTNYGEYLSIGNTIRLLAGPNDSLFVDHTDYLMYWQAGIQSSYKYSWYASYMPSFSRYVISRSNMFDRNPPDFYYGNCSPHNDNCYESLPKNQVKNYISLYFAGKQIPLLIRKEKANKISTKAWDQIRLYEYYLPHSPPIN